MLDITPVTVEMAEGPKVPVLRKDADSRPVKHVPTDTVTTCWPKVIAGKSKPQTTKFKFEYPISAELRDLIECDEQCGRMSVITVKAATFWVEDVFIAVL